MTWEKQGEVFDMATNAEVFALHRYYIWANNMRTHFDSTLSDLKYEEQRKQGFGAWFADTQGMFMSYWYGALYVVVEGYNELHLSDAVVDDLLKSENVELLKRYRNGSFHYQSNYYDDRFLGFVAEQSAVPWVRSLNVNLGRFLLEELGRRGAEEKTP